MNKRFRALLALFLAAAAVTTAGCQKGPNPAPAPGSDSSAPEDSAVTTPTETELPEETLPEKNYDGADFTVFAEGYLTQDYAGFYLADEAVGETVNDAAFDRNSAVEDRYNIKLHYTPDIKRNDFSIFKQSVTAGDKEYDLVSGIAAFLTELVTPGCLEDINTVSEVDLSRSYYFQYINDEMSMLGRQYIVCGNFDMATILRTSVVFFSTEIATDNSLGDFYSFVEKNEWTYDKMLSLASQIYADLDGDNAVSTGDQFGLCGGFNMNSMLITATGYHFTTLDEKGYRHPTGYNDLLINFNKLLYDTYNQPWYYNCYPYGGKNAFNTEGKPGFIANRYLFFLQDISYAKDFASEMGDYGILPIPKYEATQKDYYSYCRPTATAIPTVVKDQERSALVLEALNLESKKIMMPAYYNVALSSRYAASKEASQVLDTIFANVTCDFTQLWYKALALTPSLHSSVGISENYVSLYESLAPKFEQTLSDLFDSVAKLETSGT